MAKPTEAQIRELERVHKQQFVLVVGAAKFYQTLSKNYAWLPNTDYRKKALLKFGTEFTKPLGSWIKRQQKLEKAGIPKMPVTLNDFFTRTRMPYLESLVNSINAESVSGRSAGENYMWDSRSQVQGQMGFIVLIIWAVLAIAAMYTATEIVDETQTTTEERQELMSSSEQTCKDLNLTPEDCAKMINTAQDNAGDKEGIGIMGWILLAAGGFLLLKNQNKKSVA